MCCVPDPPETVDQNRFFLYDKVPDSSPGRRHWVGDELWISYTTKKKGPQLKAGKKCDERSTKCLDVYLFGSGWDLEHSQKGARTQVQHMALKSTALLFKRKTEYFTYQMENDF